MKTSEIRFHALAMFIVLLAATQLASANEALWIGKPGVTATINWSDPANFQNIGTGGGTGASQNAVVFDDSSGVADTTTNSIVDSNQNPFSLAYTNFATIQNTLIASNVTLTVGTGGLTNGNTVTLTTSVSPIVNISGGGGKLVVTNGTITVGDSYPSASGSFSANLNLTNLDTFVGTNVTRMLIGSGATRMAGTFFLARTNTINLTGTSPQLDIGDNSANAGPASALNLGIANIIFADNIAVGRSKQGGAAIRFTPAFTNSNPTVLIRAHDGVSPLSTWSLGDGNGVSGTSTGPKGTVDFSGGTVNVVVSNMWLGRPSITSATAPTGQGTLTFSAGTFTVLNNLTNAVTVTPTTGGPGSATGTVNVNGTGTLAVSNLYMAILGTGTTASTGALNINGGSVLANTIILGAGNSAINMVGGTLVLTNIAGTSALPITSLSVSNSTLQLAASFSGVSISVINLTADGNSTDTNIINITSLPSIVSFPATLTIIQAANPMTLQNGTFNFALGNLPAGYAGSIVESGNGAAVQLLITSGPSAPDVWTGADISAHNNTNWSDGLNWSAGSAPGSTSLVFFNSSSAQNASALSTPGGGPGAILPAKINNIVDANFTISALTYTNIGGTYENTFINNNDTLTVASVGLAVGSSTLGYGNTSDNVTISGPGGTLNVTNTSSIVYVGLGDASSGNTPEAVLDLSALGSFKASVANLLVGVGGYANGFTVPQPAGIIYLAETNTITAASSQPDNSDSIPVALEVGDADTQANSLGSALYLGVTNGIFADNISVARQLASGGIFFNPAFTNANPSAYFRGASASAVANWVIGDGAANTLTPGGSGTNDFTGGTVNALVNTMYVGKSSSNGFNATPVTGTLTFNAGTITANTLNVSFNAASTDGNVYSYGVGTVNVSGTGALLVNNTLNLSATAGALAGGLPVGTLNLTNGGAILANSILAGTNNATSIINVNAGTLAVTNGIGTVSAPLTSLNVTNATLDLGISPTTSTVNVTSLNADGTTAAHNTINIIALPTIASYPLTFKVIQSGGGINLAGGTFNFQLGSLPVASPPYTASISESADNTTILLTVTGGPIGVRPSVTWTGADIANQNTNWTDRSNWQLPGAPTGSDNVIFDTSTGQSSSALSAPGAGSAATVPQNINSIVDANFTISSLAFTNIGGTYQNILITNGATLSVTNTGSLTLGSGSVDFGAGATEFVNFIGGQGALNVNNTNGTVFVGLGNGSSSTESATLDMSALGAFNANISRFLLGVGSSSEGVALGHIGGTVYLAQTNNITAAQTVSAAETSDTSAAAVSFDIGDADGNAGAASFLYLGQTNAIFADAIAVGRQKETAAMLFNPVFVNPTAYFRGRDGVSAIGTWDIANGVANSGTFTVFATNDFSGGSVNALVNSMFIGRSPSAAGDTHSQAATGVLTFGAGTINVNSLFAGYQAAATSPFGVGTVNVNGPGSLVVNTALTLGFTTGGAGATNTSGTLNIGGTVSAAAIVAGTGSISTINMVGGTLAVATTAGSSANPLTSLSLSNSTLQLVASATPAITVGMLTLDGQSTTTNLIQLTSVLVSGSTPLEVPLIQYGAPNFNGLFNVAVTLPAGYSGFVTNDTVSKTVAVVFTTIAPLLPPVITGFKHSGTNLVINGTNGLSGGNYTVLTTTNITTPKANWTRLVTNTFNTNGSFSFTNGINPNTPQQYFLIQAP